MSLFVPLSLFFVHYIVYPSFSYGCWSLSIILSILLSLTAADYAFGIFKRFVKISNVWAVMYVKCFINIAIMNFLFICSNIPAVLAYEVYLSQLIRYSRACGSHHDLPDRGLLLTMKLLNQGFLVVKLKSSFRKFYSLQQE